MLRFGSNNTSEPVLAVGVKGTRLTFILNICLNNENNLFDKFRNPESVYLFHPIHAIHPGSRSHVVVHS